MLFYCNKKNVPSLDLSRGPEEPETVAIVLPEKRDVLCEQS